jgi:pimeloyl-ACP methyl ester carboxylesterase
MPFATNDGVRIYYETEGNGPTLVLYTGFSGVVQAWRDFGYVDALRDDYRLILIDPRGHGASDKPHDPAAYGYPVWIADLVAVLDAEHVEHAHFWGYSMGAGVGLATAVYAPHRLRSLVAGAPSPNALPTDPEEIKQFNAQQHGNTAPGIAAAWEEALGVLSTALRDRLLAHDVEALAAHQGVGAAAQPRELLEALPSISVPTLIYCGDRDGWHEGVQEVARTIRGVTFVTLPGLDHMTAYQQSAAIVPHVRAFLALARNDETA